ncbi:NepR family anti-sigma factor [Ancylobacter sp. IITR112]|uniref:NepR family anti-sigma factor n=1 Tax=Ancylobacter sp. IITR112 TaxID=3138073 RepID=UPI00352A6357
MSDDHSEGAAAAADGLSSSPLGGGKDTALGNEIQAKIGQHLRAMYDDVVRQGVPDRFMDLLSKLDKADTSSDGGGGRQ